MEPTTYLSTAAYQPETPTAGESVFALDEVGTDHTYSYITVDHDSTTNEVPHPDRDTPIVINSIFLYSMAETIVLNLHIPKRHTYVTFPYRYVRATYRKMIY